MIAFEVSVNGRVIQTVGAGEKGMIRTELMWACFTRQSGGDWSELQLSSRGMNGEGSAHLSWDTWHCRTGDEVTIRIVERDAVDPPDETTPAKPRPGRG